MFNYLLDAPRRELEALRAQCATQEARISKLESMMVRCAANRPSSIDALHAYGIKLAELKDNGFMPFKDIGFSLKELKDAGYTSCALKKTGFNLIELKNAGFTLHELKSSFCTKELQSSGFNTHDFKGEGYTVEELRYFFKCKELKDAGFTLNDHFHFFNPYDLLEGGFTLKEIKDTNNYTMRYIRSNCPNVSAKDYKDAGFPLNEFVGHGFRLEELRGLFEDKELKDKGFFMSLAERVL